MPCMSRPRPVTLNNPEVYPYYAHKGPNRRFMQGFHGVMNGLFRPRASYLEGSEQMINDHLSADKPSLISLGHVSWFDPCNIAAVIHRQKVLRPIIGRVVVPANAPLFEKPVIGSIIDIGGAIPTFRPQDVKADEIILADNQETIEDKRLKASIAMVSLTIAHFNQGRHVAYFSEGTRNRDNPTHIQPIKGGIVRVANAVNTSDGDGLHMILMSPYYGQKPFGEKSWHELRHPMIGIGHLALEPGELLTKEAVRQRQQECLDLAIENYR